MIKRNLILFGVIIASVLLFIATLNYPGGSQHDAKSVGYDWGNNYLCNLFSAKAVNGMDNPARPWADVGMLIFCVTLGGFFISFSSRIPSKTAAAIIKYCGAGALIAGFLAITPLHDPMMPVVSVLALLSCFYITVFVLKSKLLFLKFLSIICLILFYACVYVYFTRTHLEILPVLQKASFFVDITWVLTLEYFTKKEDFLFVKPAKTK